MLLQVAVFHFLARVPVLNPSCFFLFSLEEVNDPRVLEVFSEVEKQIGIEFKQKSLLVQAFTHPSFQKKDKHKFSNYQRLVGGFLSIFVLRSSDFDFLAKKKGISGRQCLGMCNQLVSVH